MNFSKRHSFIALIIAGSAAGFAACGRSVFENALNQDAAESTPVNKAKENPALHMREVHVSPKGLWVTLDQARVEYFGYSGMNIQFAQRFSLHTTSDTTFRLYGLMGNDPNSGLGSNLWGDVIAGTFVPSNQGNGALVVQANVRRILRVMQRLSGDRIVFTTEWIAEAAKK